MKRKLLIGTALSAIFLYLAFRKADFGEIVVQVLREDGEPVAGYESAGLRGDGVRLLVTWPDGRRLASLAGQTVSLRFDLRNARLYAFRIGEGVGLSYLSGPR